jgi:hypothetical protein
MLPLTQEPNSACNKTTATVVQTSRQIETATTHKISSFYRLFGSTCHSSSWKRYHTMQKKILHPAQHTRRIAQVIRRIVAGYTLRTASLDRFLGTLGVLMFTTEAKTGTIGCRLKFCTQHNTLEE